MHELFRTRRLPHWDVPGATYFITSCLADSIPAKGLLDIADYRRELESRDRPAETTPEEWEYRREKLVFGRTDHWLDSEPAVRHLTDPRLARLVAESMFHFADVRYELLAYVIMPSHFHWVFRPLESWVESLGSSADKRTPRERIMHSLKRHTSSECNRLLDREGTFWQDESFDHWARDDEELYRIIDYVEQNPVKARLVANHDDWAFSSAQLRTRFGIRYGEAIRTEHF
jgi:putative transposase